MQKNQLIEFDIRELGYSKRYFIRKLKKLGKFDITKATTFMMSGQVDGYDFSVHSRKNRICELKTLKDIGWFLDSDGLSDSYYLYRNIQKDKLRLRILHYILDKLNWGFEVFLGKECGRLIAHVKEKDYDKLWKDYTEGKITGNELRDFLYK